MAFFYSRDAAATRGGRLGLGGLQLRPRCREQHADRIAEDIRRRLAYKFDEAAYQAQLMAAALHNCTSRLHRIKVPALVVHGEDDRVVPVDNAHLIASRLPHGRLHLLEGTGHLYTTEAPEADAEVGALPRRRRSLGRASASRNSSTGDSIGSRGLVGGVQVRRVVELEQARARDRRGERAAVRRRDHPVLGAVHDERRRGDRPRAAPPRRAATRPRAARRSRRDRTGTRAGARSPRRCARRPRGACARCRRRARTPSGPPRRAPWRGARGRRASRRSGGVAARPPAEVAPSTSASTRSGYRSASSWAIIPPIEIPYTCARAMPAASSTETASAAIPASVSGPAGRSLRPEPRLSKRHDLEASARARGRCATRRRPGGRGP